jgi:hypothetical protein
MIGGTITTMPASTMTGISSITGSQISNASTEPYTIPK